MTWVRETLSSGPLRSSIFQYGFGSRVSTLVTMLMCTCQSKWFPRTHGTQETYKRGYHPCVISVPPVRPVGNRRSSQAKNR